MRLRPPACWSYSLFQARVSVRGARVCGRLHGQQENDHSCTRVHAAGKPFHVKTSCEDGVVFVVAVWGPHKPRDMLFQAILSHLIQSVQA